MKKIILPSVMCLTAAVAYLATHYTHEPLLKKSPLSANIQHHVPSVPDKTVEKQAQSQPQNLAVASPLVHSFLPNEHMIAHPLKESDAKEILPTNTPVDEAKLAELDLKRQERAKLELETYMNRLKMSGEGGEAFLQQLQPVHDNWIKLAHEQKFSINISDMECFVSGCASTITYEKTDDFSQFSLNLLSDPSKVNWQGTVFLTGAVETQPGTMASTLIFLEPFKANNKSSS